MKVVICGPNLRDQSKGQFHVHAAGCGDLKHYGTRGKFGGEDNPIEVEAASQFDVSADIYTDHAGDYGYKPGMPEYDEYIVDCLSDFHFAPCCSELPVHAEAPAKEPPIVEQEDARQPGVTDEKGTKSEVRQLATRLRDSLRHLDYALLKDNDDDLEEWAVEVAGVGSMIQNSVMVRLSHRRAN